MQQRGLGPVTGTGGCAMAATETSNSAVAIDYDVPEWFNMATVLVDRHVAEGRGSNPAILYQDEVLTYTELLAATNRVGNLLRAAGVGREERVVLFMVDCPAFVETYVAAMKIGAVPLPINTLYTGAELSYCISDSRATTLVADAAFLPLIQEIHPTLPELVHVIVRGADATPLPAGYVNFDDAFTAASPALEPTQTHRDDPSYWLYSSGTEGTPKGVIHLHGDMVYCTGRWLDAMGMPAPGEVHYSASKLPFSYGLVNSLYAPLMAGATVALVPEPSGAKTVAAAFAKYHPARFYSVPTLYNLLLREHDAGNVELDTSSLRMCISAGEALPPAIFERWRARFGLELLDGIGSTENGYIYVQNLPGAARTGTSGQLLPGYAVELRGELGQVVPLGESGELYLQSPSVAIGYWRKREKTKEAFCGTWYKTGDRYERDADGYLRYLGRADDVFKTAGQWVSPIEVEGLLLKHEAVAEVAVIGVQDPEGLIKPKAFVVLKPGFVGDAALEEQLGSHCRDNLPRPEWYKHPRRVRFMAELPKTPTGKIQRFKLRTLYPNWAD
ncbi:MAG: hypothetical protein QOF51_463 [Chloroflexota bacterium]|nr:hypothetical protein [Chloroflexota bacterium]